jgi:hypothetical protein
LLHYNQWIQEALHQVIRRALADAATNGLSDGHHFYITFQTEADGVGLAPYLRALHPKEMTIVLQHQFWDLQVDDDEFTVTLKFRGKRETLRVPFASVTQFADPSASFGLQLKPQAAGEAEALPPVPPSSAIPEAATPGGTGPRSGEGAPAIDHTKVITLDSFRKK